MTHFSDKLKCGTFVRTLTHFSDRISPNLCELEAHGSEQGVSCLTERKVRARAWLEIAEAYVARHQPGVAVIRIVDRLVAPSGPTGNKIEGHPHRGRSQDSIGP